MSVGSTWLREGYILISTHKGTKGAILQVHNNVYPSRNILHRIRRYPELWSKFLLKLGGIPFFSQMSIMGRDVWLDVNEVENDFFNNDKLQLLQPGVGDSQKKDGSTGKSSTLIILKTFWKISVLVKKYDGLVLNLEKVSMGDNVLPVDQVLLICLSELMSIRGAFVPNIQRFVSGLESCAKRLAVTIYEDSSVDEKEFPNLFNLQAGALTSQRVKEWRPSEKIIKLWFKTALSGYYRNIGYIVDNIGEITKEPYTLTAGQNILKSSSAISLSK